MMKRYYKISSNMLAAIKEANELGDDAAVSALIVLASDQKNEIKP